MKHKSVSKKLGQLCNGGKQQQQQNKKKKKKKN